MKEQIEKKAIEEMAFDLCVIDTCKHLPQEECNVITCAHCEAEALYNAGYRKQSEGEWIKCEEMELTSKCSICKGFHTKLSILQYDLRYCPNCGAKMKGGAE